MPISFLTAVRHEYAVGSLLLDLRHRNRDRSLCGLPTLGGDTMNAIESDHGPFQANCAEPTLTTVVPAEAGLGQVVRHGNGDAFCTPVIAFFVRYDECGETWTDPVRSDPYAEEIGGNVHRCTGNGLDLCPIGEKSVTL